ncbi:hypothetical protein [Candidatus Microthrix parvicella]|jgi:hypothetical protein|uniref:Uncharacterized protein n=1 Tax=Candidatus Neomicrothrix parvicella RN1 TaxID=1229780 RepID=R4Z7D3_9ACTN|nr:hypothetical protein [Candidatus Microthrix parvicella]CCM65312.1 hypothetical protein BN381_70011 [Candidatus Microthrix parvicella RN1]
MGSTAGEGFNLEVLPPWARPLKTVERAGDLLKIVTDIVTHRYEAPMVDPWLGSLTVPHGGPMFGLTTMAEVAQHTAPSKWRLLAYDMISTLDQIGGKALDEMLSDWDQVKDRLRVRIFGGQSDDKGWQMLAKPLGPTSYIGLGIVLDKAMGSISEEHAGRWPVSIEEVWATAEINRAEQVPVTYEISAREGCAFAVVEGDGLAVTGHALDLSLAIPDLFCPPDVAVMAPTAHHLLVMPRMPDHEELRLAFHHAGLKWAEDHGNRVSTDVFRYRGPASLSYEPLWSVQGSLGSLSARPGR